MANVINGGKTMTTWSFCWNVMLNLCNISNLEHEFTSVLNGYSARGPLREIDGLGSEGFGDGVDLAHYIDAYYTAKLISG